MGMLSEIFSWWGGNTWGTRLWTWRQGRYIGSDEFGNRYYEQRRGVGPLGRPRRWVIYTTLSEPTRRSPRSGTAGCITPSTCRRPRSATARARGRRGPG